MAFHLVCIAEPSYSYQFAFICTASFYKKECIKEVQQKEKA